MTVKFIHNGIHGIFDLDGNDVSGEIRYGIYGQRIVKNSVENLDAISDQFDDLRHLFRLPMFQFDKDGKHVPSAEIVPGLRQVHLGVNDGRGELYHDKEKIRRAVSGKPITLSLQPLLDMNVPFQEIGNVFARWGYTERQGDSSLEERTYRLDEKGKKIEVSLLPGTHPHSFIGLTQDGRILGGIVPGETHLRGDDLRELANQLIQQGAKDVFLWANGKDTVLERPNVEVLKAKGARETGLEAIIITQNAKNLTPSVTPSEPGQVRAEVRESANITLPYFNAHPLFDNLKGRFTVFADLDDVANLTDKQLTEDYEKIAVRHKNVSFVFYNDQKVISKETRQRLEKLQEQLGSHRIQITDEDARLVFSRQWVGELIHVSKRSGTRADSSTSVPRRKGLHRFRYLGDETGVVPVALLYVNQGNKGFENKVIDLSMVDQRLALEVLAYQASLVFARAA